MLGAPAQRERGWGRLLLAVVALLVLAHGPGVRTLMPLADPMMIVFPALAACCVVGWSAGGPWPLAVVWIALTIALFAAPAAGSPSYRDLARAWGLVSAGSLGLVIALGRSRTFLERALWAAGITLVIVSVMLALRGVSPPSALALAERELNARNAVTAVALERWVPSVTPVLPAAGAWASDEVAALQGASAGLAASLVPALLALETLAASALAWALYHRLSRTRLGPPLSPVRSFSFSDQLIWGLAVGATIAVLPPFAPVRMVGWNLVVFFGALYVLRGVGVLASFVPARTLAAQVATSAAALLLLPVMAPAALGVGVTDTWVDWRKTKR